MSPRPDPDLWPWLAVASSFLAAFALGCLLTASAPAGGPAGGLTDLLFGSSRQAVSADLYEQADTFFHRGVSHQQQHVEKGDWIQRMHEAVSPEAHRHTEGQETIEIIPWLKLATEADPHNVEAWLVSAFWLETGLQRADLAEKILRSAQQHNPGDYRILLNRARLSIRAGRFDRAGDVLDAALRRWPSGLDPQDRESLLDKAELHSVRGFLDEMNGQTNKAVAAFKNVLAIFPTRTYIEERVHLLETGRQPPDSARVLLEHRVKQAVRNACTQEPGDHDHDAK